MLENITSPSQLKGLNEDQKKILAAEIRKTIIETVNTNGGHMASNLGAVEMTIALHSVLNAPQDKLIFDVGHQCYTHKLLTGRYEQFGTLRQFGGISGFTRPSESEYDLVASGHASDSISLALGFAKARDLKNEAYHVAVVLGDGALTGGMCYEALNDAGQSKTRMLIVLNDNEMSISKNVGSLSTHLTHMRQSNLYRSFKQTLRRWINRMPKGGPLMEKFFTRIKNALKALFVSDMFFDALDIAEMEKVFKTALTYDKPVVVHVVTRKGKGYEPAETDPSAFHGVSPQRAARENGKPALKSCGKAVSGWLIERAKTDDKIVAVSAAMLSGTGLEDFSTRYPERCFDVGIAEAHGAAFAAGLALNGLKPFVALYSTFAQRAYDQININIGLNAAPVKLLIDRSGLNGADGETHQGVFDTGWLRGIPGLIVSAPSSLCELREMLGLSLNSNCPFVIKYPKELPEGNMCTPFAVGKWEICRTGKEIAIISYGRMLSVALEAADRLTKEKLEVCVVNARFLKPLDRELLKRIADEYKYLYVLEDSVQCGGLGEAVAQSAAAKTLCVPDRYIPAGTIEEQLAYCGIDAKSVCKRILSDVRGEVVCG